MRASHESNVTSGGPLPDSRPAGVWTLSGSELIIAEPDGPATLLVPTEQVALLGVDLPLAGRARRIEALPFAVEDRVADSLDAVHLALGTEIAPKRYLVGVVRHDVMEAWAARADEAGLGHAAIVPDALALPVPEDGAWSVDLGTTRAVVRASDGTGFACAAPLLRPAWEAAGRPPCIAYGAALPADMAYAGAALEPAPLARRLLSPPLDLRQGRYPRRSAASANVWRRLGWIALLGAAAHTLIATADTVMLRVIADRRAQETRLLMASMGAPAPAGADIASTLVSALPQGGGAPQVFLPLVSRVSGALAPFGESFSVRAIGFEANALTMDLEGSDPGLAARLRSALEGARVKATVAESPGGGIRVTASGS
jgi:general secretion pathway protein L